MAQLPIRESNIGLRDLKDQLILASGAPGSYVFIVKDAKLRNILEYAKVTIIMNTTSERKFSRMLLIGEELITDSTKVEELLEKIYELT